jgi:hypothetical protein
MVLLYGQDKGNAYIRTYSVIKRVHINRATRNSWASRVSITTALVVLVAGIAIPLLLHKKFPGQALAAAPVSGQNYQICGANATQYLTSPWTYHALASGSQAYTVAGYQALPGYGTTLPPLPSYISSQAPSTTAAMIYAPGSDTAQPQYYFPNTPILHFYEGGAYGQIGSQAVSGNMYIGGSAPGFREPTFDNGGAANGIKGQNDSYDYPNSTTVISHVSAATAAGTSTITLTSSTLPLVKWGRINIGGHSYKMSNVTGSQSGYTVTIDGGLDIAAAANAPVYYSGQAGGVTVSYLDITGDLHSTTGTIETGAGWTISHNNIHDEYSTPGYGVGIYGGDEGIIEYNCFSKLGDYAANIFGHNNKFRMNEVYDTNFSPDPGCGCSGAGKWWGTLNADITDNSWINNSHGGSLVIWLDNGNSGTLISGNYFDKSASSAIHSETGFNLNITGNLFQNGGWGSGNGCGDSNCVGAVNLNSSGGFHVPGSRYDNQISVTNNQFINNWGGIDIWQSGSRSCNNSGEGGPEDASYCSGGFPITQESTAGGQYYFSHFGNSTNQGGTRTVQAAGAGSTTVLVAGAMAINDQIDFGVNDVYKTTTSSTTNVSSLSGSQTINAASTASFPSSGQLRVGTSAAWADGGLSYTGAILSYTGKTSTSFTGVSLVRGSGALAGPVWQVQPYKVVSQTCYANDCALTVSPALAGAVSSGTFVSNAGTCQLFATSAATPTSPLAPNGTSYFDGCQWIPSHITVSDNTFIFDPAAIAAGTTVDGTVGTTCTAAHANSCGTNFMAFQESGQPPFSSFIGGNAMMSNSALTGCPSWDSGCTTNPLKNINALSNPPSAPAANNEPAGNNVWSNNSYQGPWRWNVYWYGSCNELPSDPTTGKSMPAGSCQADFATWQTSWQQDNGSTYSATVIQTYIPEDINEDSHVNIQDLSVLASKYGQSGAGLGRADINGDGTVDVVDLSRLANKYHTI